mmetsp:Transcript_40105/g.67018  ORF Transcript_40105/g.67018 Transcript_40105/m.67018 type:complete len:416 (-) Transcript_40105:502-1749(-)
MGGNSSVPAGIRLPNFSIVKIRQNIGTNSVQKALTAVHSAGKQGPVPQFSDISILEVDDISSLWQVNYTEYASDRFGLRNLLSGKVLSCEPNQVLAFRHIDMRGGWEVDDKESTNMHLRGELVNYSFKAAKLPVVIEVVWSPLHVFHPDSKSDSLDISTPRPLPRLVSGDTWKSILADLETRDALSGELNEMTQKMAEMAQTLKSKQDDLQRTTMDLQMKIVQIQHELDIARAQVKTNGFAKVGPSITDGISDDILLENLTPEEVRTYACSISAQLKECSAQLKEALAARDRALSAVKPTTGTGAQKGPISSLFSSFTRKEAPGRRNSAITSPAGIAAVLGDGQPVRRSQSLSRSDFTSSEPYISRGSSRASSPRRSPQSSSPYTPSSPLPASPWDPTLSSTLSSMDNRNSPVPP